MHLEHLALWSGNIDRLRTFYVTFFACTASARYENPAKGFSSCFLRFAQGARLELMQKSGLNARGSQPQAGLAHFAVSVGSEPAVREFTQKLAQAGVRVVGQPRRTGDGYYESVVEDPDGNLIEITI